MGNAPVAGDGLLGKEVGDVARDQSGSHHEHQGGVPGSVCQRQKPDDLGLMNRQFPASEMLQR